MGFSTVNNGEPYSNWLNNDEILSTQLRGSKGSLKALGWELVWPSTQAARSTKPLPCLPVCPSHSDSMVSDGLKLLPTVPPGLGASSLDLIYPGSIVGTTLKFAWIIHVGIFTLPLIHDYGVGRYKSVWLESLKLEAEYIFLLITLQSEIANHEERGKKEQTRRWAPQEKPL